MSLFQTGTFKLHSGAVSDFKIDCDALSTTDIQNLAALVARRVQFRTTVGVPRGGMRLAHALYKYCVPADKKILLVDDVLTTGRSMENARSAILLGQPGAAVSGVVIFARGRCPDWIWPIFQMTS